MVRKRNGIPTIWSARAQANQSKSAPGRQAGKAVRRDPDREQRSRHHIARLSEAADLTGGGHRDEGDEAARHQRQPGPGGGITEILLQKLRHELGRTEQDRANRQHHEKGDAELLAPEQTDVDDRILARQFPRHERQERKPGDDRAQEDEARIEPVVLLPLVEHDFEKAEPQRDQNETNPVDAKSAAPQCETLPDQCPRLVDERGDERERKRSNRDIDEEDPVPGRIVGDVAADRRSERRRDDDGDAVSRESLRALRGWKRVGEHRLFAWRHAAAAQPLKGARGDQQSEAGREPAQ